MSSKSARRKERHVAEKEGHRKKRNPAIVFMLVIAGVLLVIVTAGILLGQSGGEGEPPSTGEVWSSSHGHWH